MQVMGRTPAAEIRRARLERVCRLLIDTDMSINAIAELAGFNHPEVMARAFHREIGITPGRYRRERRKGRY